MDLFTRADLESLIADHERPCISLFMHTHRGGRHEDDVRFRQLVNDAESQLARYGFRTSEAREYVAAARALLDEPAVWQHQCDGLALFSSGHWFRCFRVPLAFVDQAMVAGYFHVTPLLPLLSGNGRFLVLALSQNGVRLLQGTRDTISPVDLGRCPHSLAEALHRHDTQESAPFRARPASGSGSWTAVFQGHGVGIDNQKTDLLHYFQRIDHALRGILHNDSTPLVVAAVDYLLPIFREASSYSGLLGEGIAGNPDRLSDSELHRQAWTLVEPLFESSVQHELARFQARSSSPLASDNLARIVPAAYRGDVETLFVALGERQWGLLLPGKEQVEQHAEFQPGDEELLNFAAVHTLRHRGRVYALPRQRVPSSGLLAALYHFSQIPQEPATTACGMETTSQ